MIKYDEVFFGLSLGTSVMRVIAEDKDDPMTDNAALSYSILKQESIPPNKADKNVFGIREATGDIYTLEGMDREVGVSLCFCVKQSQSVVTAQPAKMVLCA